MKQSVVAHQKFLRTTARKLRLVADLVRHTKVDAALIQLKISSKRGAATLKKVVEAAKANALNNSHLEPQSLVITDIQIMEGPTYKRFRPVSRGRAHAILKRTSHIKVVVEGDAPQAASK